MSLMLRRDLAQDNEHYAVITGQWQCGIIRDEGHLLQTATPPWRWIIQLGGSTPPGVIRDARAGSLEAAKAAFAENWRKWVAHMGLREIEG
ncbi:MAG: hypothetical protein H0V50_04840 [Thermoleophilaceae bacterium]|nr:hypothetical protein [Thermoleophilaceae bacterium]